MTKAFKIFFAGTFLFLISCAGPEKSKWDNSKTPNSNNDKTVLISKEKDFWNNTSIRQKMMDSCKSVFLPDYFLLQQNAVNLFKATYPNDTIIYYQAKRTVEESPTGITYQSKDELKRTLIKDFKGLDIPFLTGFTEADENLNLIWYTDQNKTNSISIPCCLEEKKIIKQGNWTFVFLGTDTIGTRISVRQNQQVFSSDINEALIQAKLAATMDSIAAVAAATEQTYSPDEFLKIKMTKNSGQADEKIYFLWFQRGIGLVKLSEMKSGLLWELREY